MSTSYEDVKVTFVRVGTATKLGIQLSRGVAGSGPIMISAVADGSVAAQSKRVQRGDIVAAINGASTSGMDLQRANGMLEVPAVCLTLMRARRNLPPVAISAAVTSNGATQPQQSMAQSETSTVFAPARRRYESSGDVGHGGDSALPGSRAEDAARAQADEALLNQTFVALSHANQTASHNSTATYSESESEVRVLHQTDAEVLCRVMSRAPSSENWARARASPLTWTHFQPWFDALPMKSVDIDKRAALKSGARQIQAMRQAFDNVDLDGSGELDASEMRVTFRRLGKEVPKHEIRAFVAMLDKDNDNTVSWPEFVRALTDPSFDLPPSLAGFDVSKLACLPSLFDTSKKVDSKEEKALMDDMALMERLGVKYLQNQQEKKMRKAKFSKKVMNAATSDDAAEGIEQIKSHVLTKHERKWVNCLVRRAIIVAAVAGIIAAVLSGFFESWASSNLEGVIPMWQLTVINMVVSIAASIVEIGIIYRQTFVSTLALTQATGLVLYPVDRERAFAASALVKAALELGTTTEVTYGVDPLRETSRWAMLFALLLYKLKRGLSTFLFKLFLKRVAWRVVAKSFLNYAAAPVNAVWNALTMRKVMKSARCVAMGPSAVAEVANELLRNHSDDAGVSPKFALQLYRCVGALIVNKRAVHPNLGVLHSVMREYCADSLPAHPSGLTPDEHQIVLRNLTDADVPNLSQGQEMVQANPSQGRGWHAIAKDYLCGGIRKLRRQIEIQMASDPYALEAQSLEELKAQRDKAYWSEYDIDNREVFLQQCDPLALSERTTVMCFLVLGIIGCGQTGKRERRLYNLTVNACKLTNQWLDVKRLTQLFCEGKPWCAEDIVSVTSREAQPTTTTRSERIKEGLQDFLGCLAC